MEKLPRIWVDWNELEGEVMHLSLPFTIEHFEELSLPIKEGLKIRLFGDSVEADAIVVSLQGNWYAQIIEGTLVEFPPRDPN